MSSLMFTNMNGDSLHMYYNYLKQIHPHTQFTHSHLYNPSDAKKRNKINYLRDWGKATSPSFFAQSLQSSLQKKPAFLSGTAYKTLDGNQWGDKYRCRSNPGMAEQ